MTEERPTKTVLVIEDEHQMRTLIAVVLEAAGYRVLEAADAGEAASVWKKEWQNVDLLLADVWLPGCTGPDVVSLLRQEKPDVPTLFISGMNPAIQPPLKKLTRDAEILAKPFRKEQLVEAVQRAIGI